VTLISQDLSEFALHIRAVLGLPIPSIQQFGPAASAALLVSGHGRAITYANLASALASPDTSLRLFGKPEVAGKRRMGVGLARAATIDDARHKARQVVAAVQVTIAP
jgi:phosphoribosylglycinamide formyltransferase 2